MALVEDYGNSDSDAETELPNSAAATSSAWAECFDETTGYPYYWHVETNEVRWEKPPDFVDDNGSRVDQQEQQHHHPHPADSGQGPIRTSSHHEVSSPATGESQQHEHQQEQQQRQPPNSHDRKSTKDLIVADQSASREGFRASDSRQTTTAAAVDQRCGARIQKRNHKPPKGGGNENVKRTKKDKKVDSGRKTPSGRRDEAPKFYGPSLPPMKPEEVALQKARQLEEDLAKSVMAEIVDGQKDDPPDWKSGRPRPLYSRPFSWKKNEPASNSAKELDRQLLESSIAIISSYGGDSGEDSDADDEEAAAGVSGSGRLSDDSRKRKIQVKVVQGHSAARSKAAVPPASSKGRLNTLRPVPKIFKEDEQDDDEDDVAVAKEVVRPITGGAVASGGPETAVKKDSLPVKEGPELSKASCSPPKPKRLKGAPSPSKDLLRDGNHPYKKSIDGIAELLCEKLEFLKVHSIPVSPLKLIAIKVEAMFEAWQSGALTPGYMQKFLIQTSEEMSSFENQELAPPGWRVVWQRLEKNYRYFNLVTEESQDHRPQEDIDDDDDEAAVGEGRCEAQDANKRRIYKVTDPCQPSEDEAEPCAPPTPPPPSPPPPPPPPPDEGPLDQLRPPLPPPLPSLSPPPPPPPPGDPPKASPKDHAGTATTSQVEDMELSDDDENGDNLSGAQQLGRGPVLPEEPAPGSDDLTLALNSFYSDLASLGKSNQGLGPPATPETPVLSLARPDSSSSPPVGSIATPPPAVTIPGQGPQPWYVDGEGGSQSPSAQNGSDAAAAPTEESKKRKKAGSSTTKLSTGLMMRKKGVSNLVAKWKTIQEEAKNS